MDISGNDAREAGTADAWLQLSAGSGPAECAWAVLQTVSKLQDECRTAGIEASVLEVEPGPQPGTAQSVLIRLSSGQPMDAFLESWRGTVQWIARSPFRPQYKRKNWFVGVEVFTPPVETQFLAQDVRFDTMRASGPGGQHVNRAESAVRVTHRPSGLQATASEERSQHRNRRLALARLAGKLHDLHEQKRNEGRKRRWLAHHELERGNPVRIYRADTEK